MTATADAAAVTDFARRNRDRTRRGARLFEVEAVVAHNLVPRRDEVLDELFFAVVAAVHFRDGAKPGVRAEDEVEAGGLPLDMKA